MMNTNELKKTDYSVVIVNMSGSNTIRKVYTDKERYYIKINGEVRDVTHLKNDFYR